MRCQKILLAFFILLGLVTFESAAQGIKADTTFRPHWEIGVDLLPLIGKEKAPSNSVFARRNYFQQDGRGRAWRFRAGVETERWNWITESRWTPDTRRFFTPHLTVGHEWQHVGKGFRWFAAIDGSGSYSKYNHFHLMIHSDSLHEKAVITSWTIGANGILGFQVRLLPNMWLSTEAALTTAFSHEHFKADFFYQGIFLPGIISEGTEKTFNFQVHPIYVIQLIYSLKTSRYEKKKN